MIGTKAMLRAGLAAGISTLAAIALAQGAQAQTASDQPRGIRLAQDDRADITFWESIKDSKNPAEYKAYLDTFPNGKFAALAKARLASTQAPAAAPAAPAAPPAPAPVAAPAAPAAPPVEIDSMAATMTASSNATVRSQPSTRGASLGSVRAGSEVKVTGKTKAGDWYRVAHAGKDGFISASLLSAGAAAPAPSGKAVVGRSYTTNRQTVVRQQPTADSPPVSQIPANQPVTVTGDVPGSDWYRVSYQGQDVGFVFGNQLTGVTAQSFGVGGTAVAASAPASPYGATASAPPPASGSTRPPSLPGQAASAAGTTAGAITTGATQAPPLQAAAPAVEQKIEYWTAQTAGGQGSVRIYPQPSSQTSFIAGEAYVDEQAIKVLEVIPGRRQTPWLKVETPSGKVGYVFGGQARPPGTTRSGRRVFGPESTD